MRSPRFECLFCRSTNGPFRRMEHLIPESLGNDDLVLERGSVCDTCNQYFGSKIESKVLASPPFSIERTAFAIPTKKGRLARYDGDGFSLHSTGSTNRILVAGYDDLSKAQRVLDSGLVVVEPPPSYGDLLARFFLKIGLELLLLSERVDPYSTKFDLARRCSRFGYRAQEWDVAYGIYPHRDHLKVSTRMDELGELETHQIYQYEMGVMPCGDVVLSFAFTQHVFACNISRPSLNEYLTEFNANNAFTLHNRWRTTRRMR
ncbi:MAG: hypothetical protein HY913_04775 [Desulfomonile tiedjei]|nr:hypothetical protein [Desulfomonile tiedjei]